MPEPQLPRRARAPRRKAPAAGSGTCSSKQGVISSADLRVALGRLRESGGAVTTYVVKHCGVSEAELLTVLQEEYHLPVVDPAALDIPPEVIDVLPAVLANKYHIVPVSLSRSTLTLAMADPSNLVAINEVKFLTGFDVRAAIAGPLSIERAIERYYDRALNYGDVLSQFGNEEMEVVRTEEDVDLQQLEKATEEAPVVKLVNALLTDAIKKRASDIHIEPYERMLRVRFRVDGVLHEIMQPPLKLKNAMISRIKIMASLDIAERRLPQDGRIKVKVGHGGEMDLRVSTLPTLFGEKVVMRLLDKSHVQLDVNKLGFDERAIEPLPHGDRQAVRDDPGHRTDRLRQDDDALRGAERAQQDRHQHLDRRGPGRVQHGRRQPAADARGHRPQLRDRAARLPAPGSRRHHGRRDPRLRDRRDRRQGGTHRPSRAVHGAHQRRARRRSTGCSTWASSRS